ncbi:MAG: D-tyrosyl-tRNA(Tyr) deacylase [Candidatus Eiseniibacteriota bacterium]|nr:MAG: D-tyrosyl-tRNA(Tyr) deacylase [Candidatus Eisenbacteria bacterium]
MIAVVQRVASASVSVGGSEVSRIGKGLLVLLAVGQGDTEDEARWTAEKCAELRIFEDEHGKMNRSLLETGGSALVVSQFTLYGDCSKGRRPSFAAAAQPPVGQRLCKAFCDFMREAGVTVESGVFGEKMLVGIQNDGPVTIILQKEARGEHRT